MTRILFFGDMGPTGFGSVTTDLGRAMLDAGQDVRFVSQTGQGELAEPFKSRTWLANDDQLGWLDTHLSLDGLLDGTLWADGWTPEAVLLLGDVYAVRKLVFLDEKAEAGFRRVPTYHYVPVEGIGLPPSYRRLWDIARPIAMSEFGAGEIFGVTGTRPPMVYHGVNTDDFWPVSAARPIRLGTAILRSKDDCKAYFHVPLETRICLRTDSNWPRKRYSSLMRAMAPVLASHPDAMLVMHCRTQGAVENLLDTREKFAPAIRARMVNTGFHDTGLPFPRDTLNALYNTADLYVSVSAEGFGLTIAEALACGIPAVGMDYSAVPEVIGAPPREADDTNAIRKAAAGFVVRYDSLLDNDYGNFWAGVDERAFGDAVSRLLDDPRELGLLAAKGPFHVRANFSWARAAEQMAEAMAPARVEVAA